MTPYVAALVLLPTALVVGYYLFLAGAAMLWHDKPRTSFPSPVHRLAILIPAHNEEDTVGAAIQSGLDLDYPRDMFEVIVIADNCSDRTAGVAAACGAKCLQRQDAVRRGKGFALEWAFEQLRPDGYDAFVILDADCTIDRPALREFDFHLQRGAEAIQASYMVSNPDDNPTSYVLAVGNLIENRLFYDAKSRLGLTVLIRGTGMVLKRSLLDRIPWNAHSVVEDAEYSLRLVKAGLRVVFSSQVAVRSRFPVSQAQLHVQRERWAKGILGFGRVHALRLMAEGLRAHSCVLFDAGWTLLVLSRPLVLAYTLATMLFCILARWYAPGPVMDWIVLAALVIVALHGAYFGLGILLLGITTGRLKFLLATPLVMANLTWVSLRGLRGAEGLLWNRTPR
jgi:1,2-diacylglycerol 3-beta-glucosyltransferase